MPLFVACSDCVPSVVSDVWHTSLLCFMAVCFMAVCPCRLHRVAQCFSHPYICWFPIHNLVWSLSTAVFSATPRKSVAGVRVSLLLERTAPDSSHSHVASQSGGALSIGKNFPHVRIETSWFKSDSAKVRTVHRQV